MDSGIAREESLFEAALQIEDAAERDKFLDASCAGDAELRDQLEKLLMAHAKTKRLFTPRVFQFIQQSSPARANAGDDQVVDEKLIGAHVGRYKILRNWVREAAVQSIWRNNWSRCAAGWRLR
jgi:hypothetical protein